MADWKGVGSAQGAGCHLATTSSMPLSFTQPHGWAPMSFIRTPYSETLTVAQKGPGGYISSIIVGSNCFLIATKMTNFSSAGIAAVQPQGFCDY